MHFREVGTVRLARRPKPGDELNEGQAMGPIPLEDLELVEQVKAGHTEAFGTLVQKYQDRIFNTCWRICGHLEDARDVTQEAFLKVFEQIATFRQESGFYTWLFRVAVNLSLTKRRRAKTRREVPLDQVGEAAGTQADELARLAQRDTAGNSAHSVGHSTLQTQVLHAFQLLDDDHRAVIVLRDIEELSYRDISAILEVAPGTVRSRLHRARMELRRLLRPAVAQDRQVDTGQ